MAAADLGVVEMVAGLGVAEAVVGSVVAADLLEMKVLLLKLLVSYSNSLVTLLSLSAYKFIVLISIVYIQRSLHLFMHAKEML